jgi:hypothetical protein
VREALVLIGLKTELLRTNIREIITIATVEEVVATSGTYGTYTYSLTVDSETAGGTEMDTVDRRYRNGARTRTATSDTTTETVAVCRVYCALSKIA